MHCNSALSGGAEQSRLKRTRLPARTLSLTTSSLPSERLLVPVGDIKSFYPQSLWEEMMKGLVDDDCMLPLTTYSLRPQQKLVIGKYVDDPKCEDFSNPKYKPAAGENRRTSLAVAGSHAAANTLGSSVCVTTSDTETEDPASDSWMHKKGQFPDRRLVGVIRTTYPVVIPRYAVSAASLHFPIHYDRTSLASNKGHRGRPQNINEKLHPNDRPSLPLSSLSVQKGNLNRMCLYKVGPGAVAFKVVINAMEAAGMMYTPSNEHFNILWAKRATPYTLASLGPYQKVNHFPGTWGIGRKDCLALNIAQMRRYFGSDVFDIVPRSFLLPAQRAQLMMDAENEPDSPGNPLIYIVKPAASSCGRGITLHRGVPPMPRGRNQVVCQRYVGNPLLIFGRKFDLRFYCVVTSFDPLRIYLFDEGLVRFAAMKYPGPDQALDNIHMHLTNYSLNKTAELNRASRVESCDSDTAIDIKWCLSELKQHLVENHPEGINAWNRILRESEDVVIKAILSIEASVVDRVRAECRDPSGRNCFELFGLDLMVDDNLKVRLIEANIMPSLATGTPLDVAVKSRMLAHMLTLVRIIPYRRDAQRNDPRAYVPSGPISQHPERTYLFGKHPKAGNLIQEKPLLRQFNDPANEDSTLSVAEAQMLVEAEEELRCAGGFRRIFPVAETIHNYLPLFTHGVRRNNYLLASATLMAEQERVPRSHALP